MKRFICLALALVMLLSMVPMAGAAAEGGGTTPNAQLYAKNRYTPSSIFTSLSTSEDWGDYFTFYDAAENGNQLTMTSYSFSCESGSLSVAVTEAGEDYAEGAYYISIQGVGSGTLVVTTESGNYVLPITATKDENGGSNSSPKLMYKQNGPEAWSELMDSWSTFAGLSCEAKFFLVDGESESPVEFSVLGSTGPVELSYNLDSGTVTIEATAAGEAQIFLTNNNDAAVFRITIGTLPDEGPTTPDTGGNDTTTPGLYYRDMAWGNTGIYEDTTAPLRASWDTSMGYNSYVKFYFVGDDTEIPVSINELSWSGSVTLSTEMDADYLLMDTTGFGDGSISYTRDGEIYSIPVSVGMPDIGYYSGSTASEENYISEFRVTDAQKCFYIVASNGCTLDSVTLQGDFAKFATSTIDASGTYCTITITDPSLIDERWDNFAQINYTNEWNSSGISYTGIRILDYTGIPGAFYTRQDADPEYRISGDRLDLYSLGSTTVWYMAEDGFTAEAANKVEATATTTNNNAMPVELPNKKPTITAVKREGSEVYDLKIELVQPDSTSPFDAYLLSFSGLQRASLTVMYELENTQLKFSIDGVDYAANFIFSDDINGFSVFEKSNSFGRDTNAAANPNNPYMGMRILVPGVGSVTTDEQGANVYQKVEGATVKINKVWFETILGEETTFRFRDSDGNIVASIDNPIAPIRPLAQDGYGATAFVWANITVTMPGGQIFTGDVSAQCNSTPAKIITCEYERDINTHPDLVGKDVSITDYLTFIANNYIDGIPSPLMIFEVNLGSGVFDETIVVDRRFSESDLLHLNGAFFGEATTVNGIDLNGCMEGNINNINFRAGSTNDGELTKGVFNGRFSIDRCSFYNYDIAVDSTGFVLPQITNSIFINNGIAWNVDINSTLWRPGNDYNSFINNGTAIKVACTHSANSAYDFRITESNFINNGKDFVADTGSGVYMYRNYFGELQKNQGNEILPGKYAADKHNSLTELRLDEISACKNAQISQYVQRRPAIIEVADSSTTVVANPRWKYPIKDWWKINNKLEYDKVSTFSMLAELSDNAADTTPYEDILVIDWANNTTIISEEADILIIDAEAFTEEGSKTIGVVDENESALGTWTF